MIGGFSLAAAANGVDVIAQVEIDQHCREFLRHHWGDIQYGDIRDFDGNAYRGTWLLMGGPPCQPASRAGQQRGAADDRWLWPEAIRVLQEVQPTWVLYENPLGIGDVGLAGILAEMEAEGYETRVFNIPACAVNSPHRRERYWIVAHSDGEHRQELFGWHQLPEASRQKSCGWSVTHGLAHSNDVSTKVERQTKDKNHAVASFDASLESLWRNYVWVPCADGKFRRAPDDSQRMADGLPVELLEGVADENPTPHTSLIAALGNAIVWPVAARIIAAMVKSEEEP